MTLHWRSRSSGVAVGVVQPLFVAVPGAHRPPKVWCKSALQTLRALIRGARVFSDSGTLPMRRACRPDQASAAAGPTPVWKLSCEHASIRAMIEPLALAVAEAELED